MGESNCDYHNCQVYTYLRLICKIKSRYVLSPNVNVDQYSYQLNIWYSGQPLKLGTMYWFSRYDGDNKF